MENRHMIEKEIAKTLGMSIKTVRRSINRLEKLGCIQIDKTNGHNPYTLITEPGSTLHRWKLEYAKSIMTKEKYALYQQEQQNKHVTMEDVDG